MSSGEPSRSMDDVLSAIRRIMNPADAGQAKAVSNVAAAPAQGGMGPEEGEELSLTDAMRVDELDAPAVRDPQDRHVAKLDEPLSAPPVGAGTLGSFDDEAVVELTPAHAVAAPVATPAPAVVGLQMTEAELEAMIRRIVKEELTEGEIGQNISQNILQLIEEEVAEALREGR
ncbi:MAG: hypothetical protein AAGG06_18490 [Pseudomonadota bacterium]